MGEKVVSQRNFVMRQNEIAMVDTALVKELHTTHHSMGPTVVTKATTACSQWSQIFGTGTKEMLVSTLVQWDTRKHPTVGSPFATSESKGNSFTANVQF